MWRVAAVGWAVAVEGWGRGERAVMVEVVQ